MNAETEAITLSVRASLKVRGVTGETADAIVEGVRATLEPAPAPLSRLEHLAIVGAAEWERWVGEHDKSPERIERLLALRPYRREVVALLLRALVRDAGLVL